MIGSVRLVSDVTEINTRYHCNSKDEAERVLKSFDIILKGLRSIAGELERNSESIRLRQPIYDEIDRMYRLIREIDDRYLTEEL